MKTLQINKENAVKAYEEATAEGKVLLENLFGKKLFLKDVKDRIKNFDDVLKENGITREDFENSCKGLEADETAYRKAKLVCTTYNEGWKPDWEDHKQYKYYPSFIMFSSASGGFSFGDYSRWALDLSVGSRLCFKSEDLAKHAGRLFEQEIYKPFLKI